MIIGARGRVFISLPSAGKDHIYFNSTSIRTWPLYLSISYGLYLLYPLDYIVRSRRVQVLPVRTISFGAARPKPGRAHTSFGLYRRGATACRPKAKQCLLLGTLPLPHSTATECSRQQRRVGEVKGRYSPAWNLDSYRPQTPGPVQPRRIDKASI